MSFRVKTILGIALIEAVLLTILVAYNISTLKQSNEQEIEKRVQTTLGLFASTARESVLATDVARLQILANELQSLPEIKYVQVNEVDGQLLASAGSPSITNPNQVMDSSVSNVTDGIYDLAQTITEAGQVYATIRIGFDLEAFQNTVNAAAKSSLAIAGIEILLVGLFSLLLGNYLTQQLSVLRNGSQHIARGELGFQIPVKGSDELAETAAAFNLMSHQVRKDNLIQKAIMESALDSIISVDACGSISEFNKAAEELLGYHKWEVIGKSLFDFTLPLAGSKEITDMPSLLNKPEAIQLGKKFIAQVRARTGEIIPVEIVINCAQDIDTSSLYIFYMSDIRDRIQAEKLKNEFISTVSHELRTPLTSILGALGLLNSGLLENKLQEKQLLLKTAQSNSERLLLLVNDLLDIQKIENGHLEIQPEPDELNQILSTAVKQNNAYAQKFKVNIDYVEVDQAIPVYVDRSRLLQVLANLISNACKFSPEHTSVTIRTQLEQDRVTVYIRDQGPGIPAEFRDKIFGKFCQADGASNRSYPGTGLGLAISKRLIEAHQGKIDFTSPASGGTEFFFSLPLDSRVAVKGVAV